MLTVPVVCLLTIGFRLHFANGQTEGDTGYEYNGPYDEEYDEEEAELGYEPTFDVPVVNVTAVAGQTAVLPCSIDFLGNYKVAWVNHKLITLTYGSQRIIDDLRFSIVRQDARQWNLELREVRPLDHGEYRCTVNTNPIKNKFVKLHVRVPATINPELSSGDVTAVEGETVTLVCNVTGMPAPVVTWYRRPVLGKTVQRQILDTVGSTLVIVNTTRSVDDIYECLASNDVRPAASHQIRLTVHFAPEINLPNRRMGQALGRETMLECIISSSPQAFYYWEKDGHRFLTGSERHKLEAFDEADHSVILSLRISDLEHSDYGQYTCHASNILGATQQAMLLYEYVELPLEYVQTTRVVKPGPASTYSESFLTDSQKPGRQLNPQTQQTPPRPKKRPTTEQRLLAINAAVVTRPFNIDSIGGRKATLSSSSTDNGFSFKYCLTPTIVMIVRTMADFLRSLVC